MITEATTAATTAATTEVWASEHVLCDEWLIYAIGCVEIEWTKLRDRYGWPRSSSSKLRTRIGDDNEICMVWNQSLYPDIFYVYSFPVFLLLLILRLSPIITLTLRQSSKTSPYISSTLIWPKLMPNALEYYYPAISHYIVTLNVNIYLRVARSRPSGSRRSPYLGKVPHSVVIVIFNSELPPSRANRLPRSQFSHPD